MILRNKEILVTGGAGFVGSHLVDRLVEDGHRVTVYDNLFNGFRSYVNSGAEFVEGDIRDSEKVRFCLSKAKPQIVFHLAALHYIPYCAAHPAQTLDVNVRGTQILLEGCKNIGVEKVVAISTAAVYAPQDHATKETDSIYPMDIYGVSKYTNEMQVDLWRRLSSTMCTMVRLFNVYGKRETNPHLIPQILEQLRSESHHIDLGNLLSKRDYVFMDDVVEALIAIMELNDYEFDVFNLGSGRVYSTTEVVDTFAEIIGHRITIHQDPKRMRPVDRPHLEADIWKLRSKTGWQPRYNLEQGLRVIVKDLYK